MSTDEEPWLTTEQAGELTGYSPAYIRLLAIKGLIRARKFGRMWQIDRDAILEYKQRMADLPEAEKKNPWRDDLLNMGRGRKKKKSRS